jgi:hypothetical protein
MQHHDFSLGRILSKLGRINWCEESRGFSAVDFGILVLRASGIVQQEEDEESRKGDE